MTEQDMQRVRARTLAELGRLGCPVERELPPLDPPACPIDGRRVADRCLAFNASISAAYGLEAETGAASVRRLGVEEHVSAAERKVLDGEDDERAQIVVEQEVEAVRALAWVLGLYDDLDPTVAVDDGLVEHFPDLNEDEVDAGLVDALRAREPRSADEVVAMADLYYVLHWLVVNVRLNRLDAPDGLIEEWAVERRRHALDWVLGDEDWDDLTLDT